MTRVLPDGFEVRLRPDVLRTGGGAVLVGGSPTTSLRLSEAMRSLLADDRLLVDDTRSELLVRRLLDANMADPVLEPIGSEGLTVVIPVRDRADQLDRCLDALRPLPVVVVDDASLDRVAVADVVRRHGARLVPLPDNRGPAGARNAGLAVVETPLVAFVDSDVVVDAATLLALARHCADPRVALVGPTVVGRPRSVRPRWFERYDAAASSLDLGSRPCSVRPGAAVGWLPSACLVGRTALLGGGFREGWRVAEDVDLVWRLVEAGHVVRYDPSCVARHDTRTTVRAWLGRKFLYGTGGAPLARDHGDKVAPAVLSVPMAISAAALLQRRWWSVPVAAVGVAATTRRLAEVLPVDDGSHRLAARLSLRGLGWAVRQEAGLLLRHWWPVGLIGAVASARMRRAVGTAVLLDLALFLRERTGVHPGTALVARRLDDVAYGSGLWWGAIRRRDLGCLKVRWLRNR
ncbi:MAG TPA: mycofactocin biosynthesis glycosyltransferase MftF [Nocardioides sp.]|nr:mycofactocin biosynthesis glycosyltransferase MftF [Nocardioides sp.]